MGGKMNFKKSIDSHPISFSFEVSLENKKNQGLILGKFQSGSILEHGVVDDSSFQKKSIIK
jgi:hypothetical protein